MGQRWLAKNRRLSVHCVLTWISQNPWPLTTVGCFLEARRLCRSKKMPQSNIPLSRHHPWHGKPAIWKREFPPASHKLSIDDLPISWKPMNLSQWKPKWIFHPKISWSFPMNLIQFIPSENLQVIFHVISLMAMELSVERPGLGVVHPRNHPSHERPVSHADLERWWDLG